MSVARSKLTFRKLFGLKVRSCTWNKQTQYGMLNRCFAVFITCSMWSPPHNIYSAKTCQIMIPNIDLHVIWITAYWINHLSQFILQIIQLYEKCDKRQMLWNPVIFPDPFFHSIGPFYLRLSQCIAVASKTLKDFKKMIQNEDANRIRQHNRKTCITL